jgi:RNA methyltransferase, TrmH family
MQKISKNLIKEIAALQMKKQRDINQLFIVEGEKMVSELLKSNYEIQKVVAVECWFTGNNSLINSSIDTYIGSNEDLLRISSLKTPNSVLAVVKIPGNNNNRIQLENKLTIVLDNIQDPGNMGTIIRLADWFGIENIICSEDTVELYNPKVIQSTMGAFLRVNVNYTNLPAFFESDKIKGLHVYGAFINGENIYNAQLKQTGIIVMGNESKGISSRVEKHINTRLTIPAFSKNESKTESLNVAVATAVICSEFKRRV